MDQAADGKRPRILPVGDEFTRRCPTIRVERSVTAEDVVSVLEGLFERPGEPEHIRPDNGPEFVVNGAKSGQSM